jgi:hypothetical protein
MKCEYVEEIVEGKDYHYCDRPGPWFIVDGIPFCNVHAPEPED